MKFFALALLALLTTLPTLRAQAGEAEETPTVNIRFSVYLFSAQSGISRQTKVRKIPDFYYFDGAKVRSFKPHEGVMSGSQYEYQGPIDGLRFYGSEVDLNNRLEPLAEAELQAVWKDMVLIFMPAGSRYRVIAIDKDAAHLRDGTLRVYNLSNSPIAADVGGQKGKLDPFGHYDFRSMKIENRQASVQVGVQVKNKWKLVYSSYVRLHEESRKLLLFYPGDAQGSNWLTQTIDIPKT